MNDHLWRIGEKRLHVLTFCRSALQRRPPSQRSHFEIDHLNHQADRGHFDDLIHLYRAIGQLLAVAPLELQNPRNDHINATKISARHLMKLLDHFIGHLRSPARYEHINVYSTFKSTKAANPTTVSSFLYTGGNF